MTETEIECKEKANVFFKRIPDNKEIESFFTSIFKTCETMLNIHQLDNKMNNLSEIDNDITDYSSINNMIKDTIEEILTNIFSKTFTAVNRHIKLPYSNKVNSNISELFKICHTLQRKIFEKEENNIIGILVFGILASKIIRFQNKILNSEDYDNDSCPYIKWYYGKYNSIIDNINSEYNEDLFWMDEGITWIGYNNEPVVIIVLDSANVSNDLNIIRAYIKSISSFVYINEVKQYIIITKNPPPNPYIDNNLIDIKNIYLIE